MVHSRQIKGEFSLDNSGPVICRNLHICITCQLAVSLSGWIKGIYRRPYADSSCVLKFARIAVSNPLSFFYDLKSSKSESASVFFISSDKKNGKLSERCISTF